MGGYRSRFGGLIENPSVSSNSWHESGGLGFVRSYLTSLGANKGFLQGSKVAEWRFLLSRPESRRLFSSDPSQPKKSMNQF